MKKFLSLALALIMTMSLVTISASADFTDEDAITYGEAVDVMYAIEVIGGYTDGSFDPTASLTRGAAAKIICNLILGPTTAEALGADAAPFPDVSADHVFAGYIAYCAAQGIVGGYADGNFYPSAEVTGVQFMKMLLGALGYSADIEGYTGDNWSVNVQKQALNLGLDDGNDDYNGTSALTREEACLYALNTLQATMVEYPNNTSLVVGDIAISTSSSASKVENTGSTDGNILGYKDEYMQFAESYFTKLDAEYGSDSFGRPTITWDYKSDEIGTYVFTDDLVASYESKVTEGTLYSLLGSDSSDYVTTYVDGVNQDSGYYVTLKDYYTKSSSTAAAGSGNGSITEVYEIADDYYAVITINTYVVQALSDYDVDDEELRIDPLDSGITYYYIDNDDVTVDSFVEDDYILVTIDKSSNEIKSAELAELVSGTVTSYAASSNVYVDGTKYSYNQKIDGTMKADGFTVGEDAIIVVDAQGYVVYVDDAMVASDRYVFVEAIDINSTVGTYSYTAGAYFSDGTYAAIELDEVYGVDAKTKLGVNDNNSETSYEKVWYTYTTNTDGSYDLYAVEDDYWLDTNNDDVLDAENIVNLTFADNNGTSVDVIKSGYVTFATGGTNAVQNGATDIKGNSSTVFVIVDDDGDVYTYTGIANVADITTGTNGSASVYAILDGSYAAFVFVDAEYATVKNTGNYASDFVFVLDLESTSWNAVDADYIYEYTALVDGSEETVYANDGFYMTTGDLYYDVSEDGDSMLDDGESFITNIGDEQWDQNLFYAAMNNDTIYYNGNVLYSSATSQEFSVESGSELYVVIGDPDDGDTASLMTDTGADYDVKQFSTAKLLANFLADYELDGGIYLVADDDGSDCIDTLYVYVSDTKYIGTVASTGTSQAVTTVGAVSLIDSSVSTTDLIDEAISFDYYIDDGVVMTNSQMKAILEAAGAVVDNVDVSGLKASYSVDGYEVTNSSFVANQMVEMTVDGETNYYYTTDTFTPATGSTYVMAVDGENTTYVTSYNAKEGVAITSNYEVANVDSKDVQVVTGTKLSAITGVTSVTGTSAKVGTSTTYVSLDSEIESDKTYTSGYVAVTYSSDDIKSNNGSWTVTINNEIFVEKNATEVSVTYVKVGSTIEVVLTRVNANSVAGMTQTINSDISDDTGEANSAEVKTNGTVEHTTPVNVGNDVVITITNKTTPA